MILPSRLKVGDRVRTTRGILIYGLTKGMEGVITGVDDSTVPYQVKMNGRQGVCFLYRNDVELVAETPKVREWQVPAEPTDCKRIIATDGTDEVYTYNASSVVVPWVQASSGRPCTWSEVLDAHAGVREYVQTDYEAAVEFFAKMNLRGRGVNLSRDEAKKHARAIIAHVIGEK